MKLCYNKITLTIGECTLSEQNSKKVLLNDEIIAKKVMLYNKDGEKLGLMGIQEARHRAEQANMDLVQMHETDEFAVCRVLNYDSWLYHEQKKKHKQEIKNKSHEMKEMRFTPVIGEHDLNVKVNKCVDFLKSGHKVKIVVELKGRQFANKQATEELIEKIQSGLADFGVVDGGVKNDTKGVMFQIKPEIKVKKTNAMKV